ncbi:hypothetical protein PVK06_008669 [Gossypium arboreum]|uniref:Reverse transcriptase n=1 Tax=Gossypium arboreum TaxID=29729 RepID=A0ABR0QLX6_GOSAR|nr:hypothetical protein PVK06_008669 [Gossypium arboreum]
MVVHRELVQGLRCVCGFLKKCVLLKKFDRFGRRVSGKEEITRYRVTFRCRMDGCLAVNTIGKSGGLVMMWKEGTNVEIKSYSSNHIDSLIQVENDNPFQFTGFYGNADPNNRKSSWDMLRRVGSSVKEKWIIGGDFNAILDNSEKEGGRRKQHALMDDFREKMDSEDIMDKIEKVGHDLGAWQFRRYKRMSRQIDALKSNINRLIYKPVKVYDGNKLKAMRLKLRKLLDREEQY